MAKLRVQVPNELTLEFTCARYGIVRGRALSFVGNAALLQAACLASRAEATLDFSPVDENEVWRPLAWQTACDGFFFDNTDYNVYLKAEGGCSDVRVVSRHRADEDKTKYAPSEKGTVRIGVLNFENDVDRFDFKVVYKAPDGTPRGFVFGGEVLSQKLDSRKDFKTLLKDVEDRYAMLAADYLRSTYHSFTRTNERSHDTPDLIWWNLFEAERDRFFKAIRTILERPRRRLRGVEEHRRADQIKFATPQVENEFAEHRLAPSHLYRISYDSHSNDTPENRFVKYAIETIGRKYDKLSTYIENSKEFGERISESEKAKFAGIRKQFKGFLTNPFFRGVGRFSGLKQMSLALQSAPGYATVARTYAILKASYVLFDGMRHLETKSIADLYEIWCFLQIEEIVKKSCETRYGELFKQPRANHGELNGLFVKQLGTGAQSEVVFEIGEGADKVTLAKVVYNPKITESERCASGLKGLIVPTSLTANKSQIPDIVMQLTRRSMNQNESFQLTYLFDAKYRIEDSDEDECGVTMRPPQDAIDQMHRYRDSIYYAENGKSLRPVDYKREVIGGYVLFPGVCDHKLHLADNELMDDRPPFMQSIDKVNIGAIPLRPNDQNEYGHLEDFINRLLLETPTMEAALDRLNPQHGELIGDATQEAMAEAVLYGTYVDGQLVWIEQKGLYNLPVSTAEKIGVFSKQDANRKRLLVLMSARGYADISRAYKIEACEGVVTNETLNAPPYDYFHLATRGPYYLFRISPLVKPMTNVAGKLKIVALTKGGVCKGVLKCAADCGLETESFATKEEALSVAHGVVLFDRKSTVSAPLMDILGAAQKVGKSHQPLAMDMRWKKSRKAMVRWLRILLGEVRTTKYVLYVDGPDADGTGELEALANHFFADVLRMV